MARGVTAVSCVQVGLFRTIANTSACLRMLTAIVGMISIVACAPNADREPALSPAFCPAPDSIGVLVRFLDVGQGDAALVTSPAERHVLIDGGPNGERIMRLLRALSIDSISLVVMSHNHADHIGGLPQVFGTIPVKYAMSNGVPSTSQVFKSLLDAIERNGTPLLRPEARTINVDDVRLTVLPPWEAARGQNDASVGIALAYGEFRALFTGDAETGALRRWTTAALIPHVAVLKVGHHGSRNGTTADLVLAANPALVVISVGASNTYGHPHAEALAAWAAPARLILRTDQSGTISVRGCVDGTFAMTQERGTRDAR